MHEKKGFSKRAEEFLSGKGFYIVLFVCIAVIGVSAWLLLFSEYSPLNIGDDGDYLDVMANAEEASAPIDLRDDNETPDNAEAPDSGEPDNGAAPDTQTPENTDTQPEAGTGTSENAGTLKVETKPETKPQPDPEDDSEQQTAALTPKDISYIWPINGSVCVEYSPAGLIYSKTMGDWRTHDGVDIAAQLGTKVMTVADGTVLEIYDDDLFGTTVTIDHGAGVVSIYSNLAAIPTVNEGDAVSMGSVIGSVGDTALGETGEVSHLHFAMTVNGESVNPQDYLPKK